MILGRISETVLPAAGLWPFPSGPGGDRTIYPATYLAPVSAPLAWAPGKVQPRLPRFFLLEGTGHICNNKPDTRPRLQPTLTPGSRKPRLTGYLFLARPGIWF